MVLDLLIAGVTSGGDLRAQQSTANECPARVAAARADALSLAERGATIRARARLAGILLACPGSDELYVYLTELALTSDSVDVALRWAQRAVRADPARRDRQNLLAAALYLNDRRERALVAWALGTPRRLAHADLRRAGARSEQPGPIDHGLVERAGLKPGSILDPTTLVRARRRLAALPGVVDSRVDYRIDERGDAHVEAVLRTASPDIPWGHRLILHAARLAGGSPEFDAFDPMGYLERWSLRGTLRRGEVSISAGLAHPAPAGPGVWRWTLEGLRLRIREPDESERSLERAVVTGEQSHWWTATDRVTLRVGLEQRSGDRARLGVGAEFLHSSLSGRLEVEGDGARWTPIAPGSSEGYNRGSLQVRGRTTPPEALEGWTLRAGVAATTSEAPADRLPRIGAGPEVDVRLRAHDARTRNGSLRSPRSSARIWMYAGVERGHDLGLAGPVGVGLAGFVDLVRGPAVWLSEDPGSWRTATSIGLGLRLRPPGVSGALSLDAAVDPVTGDRRVSAGWVGR